VAIAFANLGASAAPDINSSTDATSYATASWVPPTSGLLFLFVQSRRAAGVDTPTVSGNSITWTKIAGPVTTGTGLAGSGICLFGADATGATEGATTIDYGANTQLHCTALFAHVTGIDLTGGIAAAFVQAPTANDAGTAGTTGTVSLAAAGNANNRPIVGFFHLTNEVSAPRTSWVELDDLGGAGGARGVESQYRVDAFETTATATWATSSGWAGIAAEIKAATGGITINVNAIASAATVYQPALTFGAITVSVNAIASVAAVYQPVVQPGAVIIAPNAIASG